MSRHVTSSLAITAAVAGAVSAAPTDNLIAQPTTATTEQSHIAGDPATQTIESTLSPNGEQGTTFALTLPAAPINEWTPALEREFAELAAKNALQEPFSKDQQTRFIRLQDSRRALKNPLSVEEQLYELRRAAIVQNTIQALEQYVHFFKPQSTTEK